MNHTACHPILEVVPRVCGAEKGEYTKTFNLLVSNIILYQSFGERKICLLGRPILFTSDKSFTSSFSRHA